MSDARDDKRHADTLMMMLSEGEENWQRMVRLLRDERCVGRADLMADAASMIERLVGYLAMTPDDGYVPPIRSTPSHVAQKPVAWRYRTQNSIFQWSMWTVVSEHPGPSEYTQEIVPLYEAASAPSTTRRSDETPRTDGAKFKAGDTGADLEVVTAEFSGQLERELAEARDDAERLHDDKIALVRKYVTGDPRNEPIAPSATPLFTKEEADNLLSVIWDSPFACIESSVSKLEAIAGRSIRRPDGTAKP